MFNYLQFDLSDLDDLRFALRTRRDENREESGADVTSAPKERAART